jgi:hypothetical protein
MILCFLQNLWVKDPAGWKAVFQKYPDRRVGIIRHLLLDYGCLTGRRIKACFGEDLLEHMTFEEASLEIAGDARTICRPDSEHIKACIEKYQPRVIITFGKVATEAVSKVCDAWLASMPVGSEFIALPHPAARQADTVAKLKKAAADVRRMLA